MSKENNVNTNPAEKYSRGLDYQGKENATVQDLITAAELFQSAANDGYVEAQIKLGWCYFHGEGVVQNFLKAKELWERAAALGNSNAQHALGLMYYKGNGVEQSYVLSYFWFKQASDSGLTEAAKWLNNSILRMSAKDAEVAQKLLKEIE